jgi:hypothetical protein
MHRLASGILVVLAIAAGACSSGNGGRASADAAAECGTYNTCTPDAGGATDGSDDANVGAGDANGAQPTACWPSIANTFQQNDAGGIGCMPSAGGCGPSQYLLFCTGPDPTMVPPPANASLGCNVSSTMPPSISYCCTCMK